MVREERAARSWVWPAFVGAISGAGILAAVVAGRLNSAPMLILVAVVATVLTGFSTIYTVDRSTELSLSPRAAGRSGSSPGTETSADTRKPDVPAGPPVSVLVSYNPAPVDKAWARWITRQLAECGYLATNSPWPVGLGGLDAVGPTWDGASRGGSELGIDPGLAAQVAQLLHDADCVLLLVSRAYVEARDDGHRWQKAMTDVLAAAPVPEIRTLIWPVLVEACDIDAALGAKLAVDLTDLDAEGCKEELVNQLGQHRLPPPNQHAETTTLPLPGRGPGISNVRAGDATFVGRRRDLDSVHALLHPEVAARFPGTDESATPIRARQRDLRAVVVHGLGGVGKTELALQYVREFTDEYDLIWWVQASTPVSAINDLIALAQVLDLPEHANHDEVVLKLWAELRRRDRWLLIFDDVDDVASIRRAYWPNSKRGHVLVTSRTITGWESLTPHSLKLTELSPTESEDFLTRRIPEAAESPETTREVAELLGYLPLTLAQAATYIREAGTTLGAFHELLLDQFDEVIEASQRKTNENAGGYSLMLMLAAENEAPAARDLLALFSMFAASNIPRRMISHYADVLPGQLGAAMADRLTNNHTVRELSRFSLIDAYTDRFNIHPVVQSTVRSAMSAEEQRRWAQIAVRLLHRAFPRYPEEPGSWSDCAFLMPHVQAATARAERLGALDETAAELLLLAGVYLHGRCDWRQAQIFLRNALAIRVRLFGEDDLSAAECLYHLGQSQFPLAQLDVARDSVQRALEIRQEHLEPDHPLIAEVLTHLAEIIREFATENDLAISYTEQAERILREVGANEAGIADTLLIRGTILRNAGRLGDALRTQQQSLALNEQVRANGSSSVEAAANHANIGIVYRDLGQWERARNEFVTALSVTEPVLGCDHLEVAQVKKYLGDIYRRTGELALAHRLLEEVTEIHRRRPGEEHRLAACLAKLGSIQLALGDPNEARRHLERARMIYVDAYGPQHPYMAKVLSRLGPVYLALHRPEDAERTLLHAQSIIETCYGREYPALAWVLQSLAEVAEQRDDATRADALRHTASIIRRRAEG